MPVDAAVPSRPTTRGRANGIGVLALVIYFGAVLLVLLLGGIPGDSALALFSVAAACALPMVHAIRAARIDPIEPIWLYSGLFFYEHFIKPFATIVDPTGFGCVYFPIDYSTPMTASSLYISAVGYACFWTGYASFMPRLLAGWLRPLTGGWRAMRANSVLLVALPAFCASIYFFYWKSGFSLAWAYANRAQLNAGAGDLVFVVHLLGWVAAVILFRTVIDVTWGVRVFASVAACAMIVSSYVLFGSRSSLFFIPATLLIVWHYQVRRIGWRGAVFLSMAGFVIFALFAQYRAHFKWEVGSVEEMRETVRQELVNYNSWDLLLGTMQFYPTIKSYYHGELAASSLMLLVPRRVWPSKPAIYGPSLVQEDLAPGLRIAVDSGGFAGTTISQSTMGEAYADFGVIGVVGYMFIFGIAWGAIYSFLTVSGYSYSASAICSVLYGSMPAYVRNFSFALINMGLWFVVLYLLFLWLEMDLALRRRPTLARSS